MQRFLPRLFATTILIAGCTPRVAPAPPTPAASPRVFNVMQASAPTAGAMTSTDVQETARMVTRVMRIAPGGKIAEHHHPAFDEGFTVHRGTLTVLLNSQRYALRMGDVVYIPAGTTISGVNEGQEEAVIVVVFANTGRPGPLTVPGGAPHH